MPMRHDDAAPLAALASGLQSLDEGILICRAGTGPAEDGLIVAVNDAFRALTGYADEEIVGWRPSILFGRETDALSRRRLAEAAAAGRSARVPLVLYRQDGTCFEADVHLQPVPDASAWIYRLSDPRETQERETRDRQLQAELSRAIAQADDLDGAVASMLDVLRSATGWPYVEAWIARRHGRNLRRGPATDGPPPPDAPATITSGEGLAGEAWSSRRATWVSDLDERPRTDIPATHPARVRGLSIALAIPLLAGDRVIAVLTAFLPSDRAAGSAAVDTAVRVLPGFGVVLDRTRAELDVRARARQQAAVARLRETALTAPAPAVFATEVIAAALKSLGVTAGAVLKRDGAEQWRVRAAAGWAALRPGDSIPALPDGPGARALRERGVFRWDARREPAASLGATDLGPCVTGLCAPLVERGGAVELLVVVSSRSRAFSRADETFLETLADLIVSTDERSRAEAIRARLGAIVTSSSDGILGLAPDGTIESWNDGARQLFGHEAETMIGRAYVDLVPSDQRGPVESLLARVAAGERLRDVETKGRHRDDRTLDVALTLSPIPGPNDSVRGIAAIARDITQRKRLEAEHAKLRADLARLVNERTRALAASHEQLRASERLVSMGTLAAGLGHDMDNLLFPIRCRLDALASTRRLKDVKEGLHAISESIEYLQQISNGLRLLALDPESENASGAVTDIESWWRRVEPMMMRGLPGDVVLEARIDDELPPVRIAPHRLTQVIFNLVLNAGEAVGDAGLVRLRAEHDPEDGLVSIRVRDNGAGMSEEVRRRALEPFFTTKTRSLSTGLGLSIVHSVIRPAGGRVDIESRPGGGTTMTVALPVHDSGPTRSSVDHRIAAITLSDPRTAAVAIALLTSAQFEPCHPQATDEVFDSVIWVMDASAEGARLAQRYLAGDPLRQVVMLGATPPEIPERGVVVVDRARGLRALREGIRTAIRRIQTPAPEGANPS